jgi:hypothetical protein
MRTVDTIHELYRVDFIKLQVHIFWTWKLYKNLTRSFIE